MTHAPKAVLVTCRLCHQLAKGLRGFGVCMSCIRETTFCPDCNSDVTVTVPEKGRMLANIEHDDSCPWYAELRRDGGQRMRFYR